MSFIATFISQTVTITPTFVLHNKRVFDEIIKEMKRINNGLFTFDIKLDNKHITDLVIRDNGRFKT
jgi:hypothetical protein